MTAPTAPVGVARIAGDSWTDDEDGTIYVPQVEVHAAGLNTRIAVDPYGYDFELSPDGLADFVAALTAQLHRMNARIDAESAQMIAGLEGLE